MNSAQALWWTQAHADLALFEHLRGDAKWRYTCHTLQALQMAAEKIAKASFRVNETQPPQKKLTHVALAKLIRRLSTVRATDQPRVAKVFGVDGFQRFEKLLLRLTSLAKDIEKLPPAVAGRERMNTEYPWPDSEPVYAPAEWRFEVWERLQTAEGREFIRFLSRAIERFEQYADVLRSGKG